jgi:hypothetical protein
MNNGHQSWVPERLFLRFLLVTLGVAFFYVASYGPALSFGSRKLLPNDVVRVIYRPLPAGFQNLYIRAWRRLDRSLFLLADDGVEVDPILFHGF